MNDELVYEVRDGVGFLMFNRPDSRNALTFQMYETLSEIARSIRIGGEIKALILSGAGDRAFAAGTDMSQFRDFSTEQQALDYEAKMERILSDLEACPVPTIAAITGACTGGGAAIAAACDLRICDTRLKFGFPIARTLGNCLSIKNLGRLTALLGHGLVTEIMLTARLIEAEEALAARLVSKVLPDPDAVRTHARALAETLKGHAPLTMRASKEGLRRLRNEGADANSSDLIAQCYTSNDFKQGMEAFLAKTPPNWKGN